MKELISLDQMFDNLKEKNGDYKLTIESNEKTIEIVNKIIKARENMGLTQRELAEKCGMKQPAIARIETFKVVPRVNTLIRIAEAVGVNIEAFTPYESQHAKFCYSVSRMAINSTFYDNGKGGYLWKQNLTDSTSW